ncbi:MAG: ABC transporter ATP-binding protein [Lachnospiraceae bacterium]|nr:ABC transporter ATP-binding protein [Lachnospiraceae bacterium]
MIKLSNISKFYYSEVTATLGLRNVNLEFEKGEFVAITGESGSGKSTLINVISGMDTYEDGELYYNGEETSGYSKEEWDEYRRNKISFIYQSYNLIDSYTAVENIESVLLICEKNNGRMTDKERRKKAMECLKMVGLEKQAKNRASHMSSGQKQRLGIARALAKNTDVIIADEPTGNLDIENGNQVMKILYELSKSKLVIVVTHNYDQAEQYATRKVRMFDGEVVENRVLRPKAVIEEKSEEANDNSKVENVKTEATLKKDKKSKAVKKVNEPKKTEGANDNSGGMFVAKKFVKISRKATPHRNMFVFSFMLVAIVAITFMIGIFSKNMDDSTMRSVSTKAFKNVSKNRIIVMNVNGGAIDIDDAKKLKKISKVESVDVYGAIADINYYYIEGVDYTIKYTNENMKKSIDVNLLSSERFMKSDSNITKKDLAKGRLPENFYEVVIYSEDESVLGTKMNFYFANSKQWGLGKYTAVEMTVVGLLKDETEEAYFDAELCNALEVRTASFNCTMTAIKREVTEYDDGREDYIHDQDRNVSAVMVLNPSLEENQVKITQNYFIKLSEPEIIEGVGVVTESIHDEGTLVYKNTLTGRTETFNVKVAPEGHSSHSNIVEVSSDIFWKVYFEHINDQSTVYINDYANTDRVIEDIGELGYEAISVFRTSAVEYDNSKIVNQFKFMLIALATIVVVFVLFILVIFSLMKLKKADFIILTSLGMSYKTVKQMNYYDLITMVLLADVVSFILMNVLAFAGVDLITSFINYYKVGQYAVVIVLSVVMAAITSHFFSSHLLKKFRITALKGE